MLILLPPSEGKTPPRRGKSIDLAALVAPELSDVRRRVMEALVEVSASETGLTDLGLSDGQVDQLALNLRLSEVPTARADQVYDGVLYEALGFASLSPAARRRASSRILITSSLFGVVRPQDRIPAYRLSGGVNLPGIGPVAGTWREALDVALPSLAGRGLVMDLRSSTYAAFWRPAPEIASRVATVRVLHEVNGKRSIVSHFNKATKGRIVRALLEDGADPRNPKKLAETLTRLGWVVEVGASSRTGTALDVVVSTL